MQLPLRHQDTKNHKELIFSNITFVLLCAFVPWWQKKYFSERAQGVEELKKFLLVHDLHDLLDLKHSKWDLLLTRF